MEVGTRSIWCQTTHAVIHGRTFRLELEDPTWWQRLLRIKYEPGIFVEWGLATEDDALKAFDLFRANPVSFKIDAGGTIEFIPDQTQQAVLLSIRDFDDPLTEAIIPMSAAKDLISFIYQNTDDQIITHIRSISLKSN